MSSLAGRRKRTVIAAIVSDPYRKLAAIALALGLWYFLNSQISRPIERTLGLVPGPPTAAANQIGVVLGNNQVIGTAFSDSTGQPLENVKLTLYGQNTDIARVEAGLTLTVSFEDVRDWSRRDYVEFDASDLRPQSRLHGLTVTMEPAVVRLDVEALINFEHPISLDDVDLQIDNDDLRDRLRRDTAKFSPETARIEGPANSITALKQQIANGQPAFRATIVSKRTDRDVLTVLRLNVPDGSGLKFERAPSMALRIDPLTETFKLEIEIDIDDLALPTGLRGQYVVDGDPIRLVEIKAGGELLSELVGRKSQGEAKLHEWARQHLRLKVWIEPLDPQLSAPTELTRPAELRLYGPLYSRVDRSDYSLAEPLPILLEKKE